MRDINTRLLLLLLLIAISAYPKYSYAVWHGKTRMAWLPDGEKNYMFIRFDMIHERDRHTDGQLRRTDTA